MTAFASALAGGYYRARNGRGERVFVLLCGRCAEKRGLWPAEWLGGPETHHDCSDCGGPVD